MTTTLKNPIVAASWEEYETITKGEWNKQFFCDETGGYIVSHVLKANHIGYC